MKHVLKSRYIHKKWRCSPQNFSSNYKWFSLWWIGPTRYYYRFNQWNIAIFLSSRQSGCVCRMDYLWLFRQLSPRCVTVPTPARDIILLYSAGWWWLKNLCGRWVGGLGCMRGCCSPSCSWKIPLRVKQILPGPWVAARLYLQKGCCCPLSLKGK